MPLKCPKCSRINPDKASACLYCKTSLANAEKYEPPAELTKIAQTFLGEKGKKTDSSPPKEGAISRHSSSPVQTPHSASHLKVIPGGKTKIEGEKTAEKKFWVVLSPSQLSHEMAKKLADYLELDTFVVKQRIATGNPWVMRKFDDATQSQSMVKELIKMGFDVYTLSDEEINNVPKRMLCLKVTLEEDGLLFEKHKEKIKMKWNEASFIVRGKIKMTLAEDSLKEMRKRQVKKPGLRPMSSDSWEYEVYEIYSKDGQSVVRLSERDTSFTGLGKNRSLSSLQNMRWIVEQFQKQARAVLNENYKKTHKEFKPVGPKSDMVAGKLGRKLEEQLELKYIDNSEHFEEFSTLAWLHFQKLEA